MVSTSKLSGNCVHESQWRDNLMAQSQLYDWKDNTRKHLCIKLTWKKAWWIFVKWQCKHFICGTESVFHPIPMMKVKVNIENSLKLLSQLENGHNDVIEVTETRSGISGAGCSHIQHAHNSHTGICKISDKTELRKRQHHFNFQVLAYVPFWIVTKRETLQAHKFTTMTPFLAGTAFPLYVVYHTQFIHFNLAHSHEITHTSRSSNVLCTLWRTHSSTLCIALSLFTTVTNLLNYIWGHTEQEPMAHPCWNVL